MPSYVSEADVARSILGPFCQGIGMDVGFGGSATTPECITFDQVKPYTCVGSNRQIIRGDCRRFPFLCDGGLDFLISHHLLEDFSYPDLVKIISEWRRCLKMGGLLITNCPDQQRFLSHCARTSQPTNLAHVEQDFSLDNFKNKVLSQTGPWEPVFEQPEAGPYSWYSVVRKS